MFVETKCQSIQKQSILGILIPEGNQQSFVILNFGAGASRVSGNSEISINATKALYQQWSNPLTFREIIVELGGEIVNKVEHSDYNFELDNLQKDSFIKIFE